MDAEPNIFLEISRHAAYTAAFDYFGIFVTTYRVIRSLRVNLFKQGSVKLYFRVIAKEWRQGTLNKFVNIKVIV